MRKPPKDILQSLRERSNAERKYIALGSAGGITGIIVLFWMVNLSATFDEVSATSASAQRAAQSLELVRNKGNELRGAFDELKKMAPENMDTTLDSMEQRMREETTQVHEPNETSAGVYPTYPDITKPLDETPATQESQQYVTVEGDTTELAESMNTTGSTTATGASSQ